MKTREQLNSININLANEIIWLRAFISTHVLKSVQPSGELELEDPNKFCVLCAEILFVDLSPNSSIAIQRKRFESAKLPVEMASLNMLKKFVSYAKHNYKPDARPVYEAPFKEAVELDKFK